MRTDTRKKTLCHLLIMLAFCFLPSIKMQAQAFDGDADVKIYAGYMNVGGKSGFEIGNEYGLNDFISLGVQVNYVFIKEIPSLGKPHFTDGYDISAHINYHWTEVLKLPSTLDIYSGATVGMEVVGIQNGLRYNFGELLGIYIEAQYNPLGTFKHGSDYPSPYKKKFSLSAGLTFNI